MDLYKKESSRGSMGMVSSAHPIATRAGVDILKRGGNAFDAAVTVAAVLNVVEPMMSGIGGYGTIIIYDAKKGEAKFLNSSGRIPKNVDSDVFRPPTQNWLENRTGAKAISTPGNVNAWEAMWKEYGTIKWTTMFEQAIHVAEEGFPINNLLANFIESTYSSFPPHAREIYGKNGFPLKEGECLVQTDLSRSLRMISEQGSSALYKGTLGDVIDRAMHNVGGFLTFDDLKENKAEWGDTIQISYKGYEIITAAPPANSFPALVRLGMMSRYDVQVLEHNTVEYLHRFAEVSKHAFWVRLRCASDPEVCPVPLDNLLSEKYWKKKVDQINLKQASPFKPPYIEQSKSNHTTHFVIADKWGNVVSATQTIGGIFGSRIMPDGTGIWLNNSLAYCTYEPKGNPMDAFPGRHKLSGDVPTLVLRDGRPFIAIGTPGGHTIAQTIPQMIMNVLDFGMDIQRAISAPRISFIEPDTLAVEQGIPIKIRKQLKLMGHNVKVVDRIGNAHGLTIQYDESGKPVNFEGAADPRCAGIAQGV